MAYSLRLIEDRLAPSAGWETILPAANRVLYVAAGDVMIGADGLRGRIAADQAWCGPGAISGHAGADGAHVLRVELVRQPPPPIAGGTVVLEHPIPLDGEAGWLMRCDRVDFEPGGVALPHRHRGGGIRRLLRGGLEVTVGAGAPRLMRPGDAWFESGREPVLAVAAREAETSFLRVSVLPAEVRGTSSIMYVNPDDAARSKPRTYTVYVDQPIDLSSQIS
jgi:quercetin dioxygenase-like cupin family protein